jgi:hypothetical protein
MIFIVSLHMLASGCALQIWIHWGKFFSSPSRKTCGAIMKAAALAHASLAGLGPTGATSFSSIGAPDSALTGIAEDKHNEPMMIADANLMSIAP